MIFRNFRNVWPVAIIKRQKLNLWRKIRKQTEKLQNKYVSVWSKENDNNKNKKTNRKNRNNSHVESQTIYLIPSKISKWIIFEKQGVAHYSLTNQVIVSFGIDDLDILWTYAINEYDLFRWKIWRKEKTYRN